MHVDESKKFDKRNIERNIKDGIITLKDYEAYLSRLPDVSDKILLPEGEMTDFEADETLSGNEMASRKKSERKKSIRGR